MAVVRDRVVFFLNGERTEATAGDATLSVSDYLRLRRGMTGTKIVCSEGDCGSCSVLVGRRDGRVLRYQPIDSCIQFVFQLDGAHLVTVEGLGGEASSQELSPVQQAMVDCHGSQCGFCTPGFVMAMTGLAETGPTRVNGDGFDEAAWREGLTGNLCRCTGYTQILEAAQRGAADQPPLADLYDEPPMLSAAEQLADEPFEIANAAPRVYSPTALSDALHFHAEAPDARVVAGATDIGVQRNKGRADPPAFLDLSRVSELRRVQREGETLTVGAGVSWTTLLERFRTELPEYAKVLSVFGSPQIRHAGTIGGNLINASPIADSIPLLYVVDAKLVLASHAGERAVAITDFYRDYKQFDLRPDELLTRIEFDLPAEGELLKLDKVSRRRDMDISTFTSAIRIALDGDTIASAAVAMGAVGPTVLRLRETEASLVGRPFTLDTMREAGEVAVGEITPLTDVRGRADYRYQLARNMLLKFYTEQTAAVAAG